MKELNASILYFCLVKIIGFVESIYYLNQRCYKIFKDKLFERIILNVIIISSFKLILDTYYSEDDLNMNESDKAFV